MATTASDKTIILNLLRGAVPERADEISGLWRKYGHSVEIAKDAKGVTMNANSKRIKFNIKTIEIYWLLGFSAWRAIEVYSPAVVVATMTGASLDDALNMDEERGQFEFDYKQRIASVHSLIAAEQPADISWPADIPKPIDIRDDLEDVQHKAAFDLVGLALAFSILHEFQHVMFCADKNAPSLRPEEEIACDTWARDFMMSGLADYAEKHGHSFTEVQWKRAAGITLAAVIIHAITPGHVRWGDQEYPPIAERLSAMIRGYNLPNPSSFWMFTACMLIALLRQENRPLDIVAKSNREMVEELLIRLC
ncbi:phage exclusion protein Lit family protein [Ectopseudomonas chengduensis]|uniref:Peptidase U49 n=1 Tax=Ectopseudomonas guguanensis TaxID=1198456 RepID=A0A1H0X6P5_9GAMM|nr:MULTISPECIES: phage exclusion protein Lit family protein [Pseudomonas]MDH1561559.1 phage exclusion protein Lit family protein [Pseudomonas chengduensis]SDP98590.1 Peptidase U49 [Pseudomonas guguanensis]